MSLAPDPAITGLWDEERELPMGRTRQIGSDLQGQ